MSPAANRATGASASHGTSSPPISSADSGSWWTSISGSCPGPLLLGSLPGEVLRRCLGIRLGRMDGSVGMLGRRVQRVELQRFLAGVPDVVPGAGGNDDGHV